MYATLLLLKGSHWDEVFRCFPQGDETAASTIDALGRLRGRFDGTLAHVVARFRDGSSGLRWERRLVHGGGSSE